MLNLRKQGKTAFLIMDKRIIKDRGRPRDSDARDETGQNDEEDNEVLSFSSMCSVFISLHVTSIYVCSSLGQVWPKIHFIIMMKHSASLF